MHEKTSAATIPQDFPLLPRPIEISETSVEFLAEITEQLGAGEAVGVNKLSAAVAVLTVELMAQLEWRNRMVRWLDNLDEWLDNSPNIRRKGE